MPKIARSKLPKFVMMMQDGRKGCAMRLMEVSEYPSYGMYWRDGGMWGIYAKIKDGKLVTDSKPLYSDDMLYLNEQELIPITEEEWREDNGQYAPSLKKVKTEKNVIPY